MSDIERYREFDCVECGRHIVRFVHHAGEPLICAECIHVPGWFHHAELAAILDPEHHRREANGN